MNAYQFLKQNTQGECESVAKAAGTTLGYFKQLAYGFRLPSRDLALKLAAASGGRMTAIKLLGL